MHHQIIISSDKIINQINHHQAFHHRSSLRVVSSKFITCCFIEIIEIIWLRSSFYSIVVRSQSRVVSSQKSLIHFEISVSITHFSLSVSVTHFFRLYNFTFFLTFFFFFFHIISYVKQLSILCFLFLFLLLFCFLFFALLSRILNWLQFDYFIFALLLRILNWFIFCFSLKLLFLRIS